MDPVSMDSAKLALLLKGPAVAGLDPPKRYRILRIGAHSITYGPQVIPLRNVVSVTMRSKLLQDGTRARQLIEMLITGIVLVGIALFDTIANQSALLKWTLASHAATIVLLLLLVKNAAPIALALLVGSGAAVLLWPNTAAAPQPELFGEYYAALERIWSGFAKPGITMLIVATGAALYASLSFLRSPWHARDIKAVFPRAVLAANADRHELSASSHRESGRARSLDQDISLSVPRSGRSRVAGAVRCGNSVGHRTAAEQQRPG